MVNWKAGTCKLTFVLLSVISSCLSEDVVRFQWNLLNFSWPSTEVYNKAISDGFYQPINNIITGIKVWKNHLYLTLPRWKSGIPATLTMMPVNPIAGNLSPLLHPFPTWEMQILDDCRAFQFVQSMEIDPFGRMWILDNGRIEFMTNKTRNKCPPRLLILDLEKDGQILLEYVFPAEVAHKDTVFINDIVLDHEDGGWAYITDHDTDFPGIIVFSLKDRISWKIRHKYMEPKNEASIFQVNGTELQTLGPIDGIALSPASTEGNRTLFFTPLSSFEVFTVPTWVLKTTPVLNINNYFQSLGRKSSQTDGMVISSKGILYYGLLTENAIASWALRQEFLLENQRIIYQDANMNQWPDTFAVDHTDHLWWVSNRIQRFQNNIVDLSEPNYRVLVMKVCGRSYQYYEDGRHPKLPNI